MKKKILIITQIVDKNDPILGFFHSWILEFAKNFESVIVVCLKKGEYNLPSNVEVLSLGKEEGVSRIKYLFRFYKYIFSKKNNYDSVFVHMNPIYVILGGVFWKMMGKRIALWYTHKNVDMKLRLAEKLCDSVFSASKESFRLPSKKLHIMGHGIDTSKFSVINRDRDHRKIVSIGRVSIYKNYEPLLEAISILKKEGFETKLSIVGPEDKNYKKKLLNLIDSLNIYDRVEFLGPISQDKIPTIYNDANIFVNLSKTGSLDKAILEAMSCGLNVLTSNEAMSYMPEKNKCSENPQEIAQKIKYLSDLGIDSQARDFVTKNHELVDLIKKIKDHIL
ncbi:MAG: glycosyltransferase family 4 protein [Candidatus Nomurabacteria bacterium]|nr:MAG: glycosyltransferase family 4 protein [Candidatus Nomurabacteria bacterium]